MELRRTGLHGPHRLGHKQVTIDRVHLQLWSRHTPRIEPGTPLSPIGKSHKQRRPAKPADGGAPKETLKIDNEIEALGTKKGHLGKPPREGRFHRPHPIHPVDALDETSPLALDQPGQSSLGIGSTNCRAGRHRMHDVAQ